MQSPSDTSDMQHNSQGTWPFLIKKQCSACKVMEIRSRSIEQMVEDLAGCLLIGSGDGEL